MVDVSALGAGFQISHQIEVGRLLRLTIPMPRQMRHYDYFEPQYQVWSIIRHVRKLSLYNENNQSFLVGTGFIGKNPPASFEHDPHQIYEVVQAADRGLYEIKEIDIYQPDIITNLNEVSDPRQFSRYKIPLTVIIETFDNQGQIVSTETTVTENISKSGASVFSTLNLPVGSVVRLTNLQTNYSILAKVKHRRVGDDKMPRLHLHFFEQQFPLEGIE